MPSFTVSGLGWSHEVIIGLEQAAPALSSLCGGRRVPLVSDERVLGLHGKKLSALFDFEPVTLAEGEAAKSWGTLQHLIDRLAGLGVDRRTPVIAFGGGSIGDVAGLAAALFKRGCPVINMPTTLLAQVDSAVGGKTAIDAAGQKNLVGTFHPPALAVCEPAFLETLDSRQMRAGYAEVVKYGLIDDAPFFAWCEEHGEQLLSSGRGTSEAVEHCLRAKARLIGDDLRDLTGRRALLNLGHSFAHAIEALLGFGTVLHGEAVAVGLCSAFDFSHRLGLCPAGDAGRVRSHLRSIGLPTRLADVGLAGQGEKLLPFMLQDKKAGAGRLTLILVRGIGQAFVAGDVSTRVLAEYLAAD